jgi:glycerol-3-phosphate dehydrogenase
MKTLSTLLFAVAASVSFTANAGSFNDALYGDPAINDVFPIATTALQAQALNTVADTGELVWSVEYEEFVNPADFNATRTTQTTSLAGALQALDDNPPAAGNTSDSVFLWDEDADEYQLQ